MSIKVRQSAQPCTELSSASIAGLTPFLALCFHHHGSRFKMHKMHQRANIVPYKPLL